MARRETSRMIDLGEATTIAGRERSYVPSRLVLVVVGGDTFATYPLPDAGEVTLGRSDRNDIRIDDPSVSREHAVLHIGETLVIEDLGGANGTTVSKVPLPKNGRAEVQPDHVVDLGSTMLIVQRSTTVRPRRLWTHDYFEARIEEECARAARRKSAFGLVRIHVERDRDGAAPEAMGECLSSVDVVAAYGPGEYEVLLVDTPADKVRQTAEKIAAEFALREVRSRIGTAIYPDGGRTPEALMATACEAVRAPAAVVPERPVIVEDSGMKELHRLIERVAQGTISVMLLGETGVGKEILAEAVHRASPRASHAFLRLNCATLSESLLESELFGHEQGAFTGADREKPGLLESAQGGTVFFDEIGELPMALQVKLLRVLEDQRVLRVGALTPRPIDVRYISATNRELEQEVQEGRFRADLYFRLNGIALTIPPLRDRQPEIAPLARAFARHLGAVMRMDPVPSLSTEALDLLLAYTWPGNIRELRNIIERALLLTTGDEIRPEHLPVEKMRATLLAPAWSRPRPGPKVRSADEATLPPANLSETEIDERTRIVHALEKCGGNQTQAAKILGMSRRTLVSRLDKYDIPRPRKR